MSKNKTRDPLGPLDVVTYVLASLLITALALGAIAMAFGADVTIFGIGEDDVCVTSQNAYASIQTNDVPSDMRDLDGLKRHVTTFPDSTTVCDKKPGLWGKALLVLTQAPTFFVFLGFILLARRIITYAQRNGLFSRALAARIERLGWLLVVGLVLSALVEWLAEGLLLSTMTTHASWASGSFGISIPGIIGAYGLVSIGRIMNRAAALQADADATI
ncbi:MAG: hypothetical protein QOH68_2019 [Nocardioidaceae bacterium]|jgi:hypothetical protein|nr:hypothetical protein [Nocardioidaceae bacterium]